MLLVNIRGESKFELFKTTNFLKGLLINKKETKRTHISFQYARDDHKMQLDSFQ
jgi:hypothetical protein